MTNNDKVLEIANRFSNLGNNVLIDYDKMNNFCDFLLNNKRDTFEVPELTSNELKNAIVEPFINASLQYCFWYGESSYRPFDNHSGKMTGFIVGNSYINSFNDLRKEIRKSRFVMIEERMKTIDELENTDKLQKFVDIVRDTKDVHQVLDFIVENYDCYSDDLFLKKAYLCLGMIHQRTGIFTNPEEIFVPVDYQIPKILNHFGVTIYKSDLHNDIMNDIIIPKNSMKEIEIRACAMKVINESSKQTGINQFDIDQILFLQKNKFTNKHHLTYTTAY
jgi:hypothetical protein